ncbi:hypothetical protein B0H14DRAFT_2635579 [Mycena olivaceomarginata]|nr:hypothetical protein B0H14DRAFT_2635579 [Mycena olivaceomarginata]
MCGGITWPPTHFGNRGQQLGGKAGYLLEKDLFGDICFPSPDPPPLQTLWSRTPKLPKGYELMPSMRDLLQTLPTNEQRERMYQLARLGSREFMRENALRSWARHAGLRDSLANGAREMTKWEPKRKAKGVVMGKQMQEGQTSTVQRVVRERARRVVNFREVGGKVDKENGNPEDEGDKEEGERKEGGEHQAGAQKEHQKGGENVGGEQVRWPKWLADGHTLLSACPEDGSKWKEVVETWVQLEKAYGFKTSGKRGLKKSTSGSIRPIDDLQNQVVKWWSGLTPAWRNKDKREGPEVGEKVGEWGVLGTSGSEWHPDDIAPTGLVEGGRGRRSSKRELARRCAGCVVRPPRAAVRCKT